MYSQMQTLFSKSQALQIANRHGNQINHGKISDADVVTDVDAAPVGELDVDADDHQLHPLQSTDGITETAHTGAKNVHNLPTDKIRMRPLRT